MNIDTMTLQFFLAVAETRNITRAANRVGRTQSAISQQMAKLESMIGKPLFVRGKDFHLTPEGEIFLGYARKLYALHRETIDRFKEPELHGEFRFGLPENFASVYLSEILVEFFRIHPRIFINIECDLTLNLYERFKRNELDMVLLKMNRPEEIPFGVDVYSEELEWVHQANLMIEENEPIPLILSPEPCVYRAKALKALESAQIKWRVVFSSPSFTSLIAAVNAGLGITVLPRTMIPAELEVMQDSTLPKLDDAHLCLLKHSIDNPAIQSFEKFVLAKLKY